MNRRHSTRKVGEKFSPTERASVLAEVERLDRLSYSPVQIADRLGLNHNTIYKMLREIQSAYVDRMLKDRHAYVANKLEQYRYLRYVAWEAYERSKEDHERETSTSSLVMQPGSQAGSMNGHGRHNKTEPRRKATERKLELLVTKKVKTRSGRLPGVEYLRIIKDTYDAERAMLGLDEAIKLDVQAQVIDWSVFHATTQQGDIIEQRIAHELEDHASEMDLLAGEEENRVDMLEENGEDERTGDAEHVSGKEEE